MRKVLASLALCSVVALTLAGCSRSSPLAEETATAPVPVPSSTITWTAEGLPVDPDGNVKYGEFTPDVPRAADFIPQFRSAYPLASGQGRADKHILRDPAKLCGEIQAYAKRGEEFTHEDAKTYLTLRIPADDAYRDRVIDDQTATGMVELTINVLCPEYVEILP